MGPRLPYRLPGQCIPEEEAWFVKCLIPGIATPPNISTLLLGSSLLLTAISFFFDIFLTVLPWRIVKNLRLQRHEKILLAVSMSLGVV